MSAKDKPARDRAWNGLVDWYEKHGELGPRQLAQILEGFRVEVQAQAHNAPVQDPVVGDASVGDASVGDASVPVTIVVDERRARGTR